MKEYTGPNALGKLAELMRAALDAKQDKDQAVTLEQVTAAIDAAVCGAVEEAY